MYSTLGSFWVHRLATTHFVTDRQTDGTDTDTHTEFIEHTS